MWNWFLVLIYIHTHLHVQTVFISLFLKYSLTTSNLSDLFIRINVAFSDNADKISINIQIYNIVIS